jgi:hypothetical protein
LLFPVILITGNSDVNDINDLAISARSCNTQTLHLVFCTTQTARRDASGPAVRRPGQANWSTDWSGIFGTWHWPRGLFPVPPHSPIPPASPFNPVDLSIIHWGSVAYIHERRPQVLLISFYDKSGIF